MSSPKKPSLAKPEGFVQIKVTLYGSKPAIWRRLFVPGALTLYDLHAVLQIAFDWTNSHLHQFADPDNSVTYSNPDFEMEEMEGVKLLDDSGTFVGQAMKLSQRWIYEYDFGDSWNHVIDLEPLGPQPKGLSVPLCIAGKRAAPPDDCGGFGGYADLLKAIGNPKHAEHEDMQAWLEGSKGPGFDPDVCDIERINTWLGRAFASPPKRKREEGWWYRFMPGR